MREKHLEILEKPEQVKTCQELLAEFREREELGGKSEKIKFSGIDGKDVYNITAPFEIEGETYILGRVEVPETDKDSHVMWFKKKDKETWEADKDISPLKGEDPFAVKIKSKKETEFVLGVVRIFWQNKKVANYQTNFYKGRNLKELKEVIKNNTLFAKGPDKMKNIRLTGLPNGKIGVFTRPENDRRKEIGFLEINSLEELNAEKIGQAKIIQGLFAGGSYGGANEIHILDKETLGILGHIAWLDNEGDEDIRHYYAITFKFNLLTHQASSLKIIAERSDFPPGKAKKPYLQDVVFTGGLRRNKNGTAVLYVGLSDKEAGKKIIKDPFVS